MRKHVGMPLTSRNSATVHSLEVSVSDVTHFRHLLWDVYIPNFHLKLRETFRWYFPFNKIKINIINYFLYSRKVPLE